MDLCVPAVGSGQGDEHGVLGEAAGKRPSQGKPRLQGLRSDELGFVQEALASSAALRCPLDFFNHSHRAVRLVPRTSLSPAGVRALCPLHPSPHPYPASGDRRLFPKSVTRLYRFHIERDHTALSVCLSVWMTSLSSMPRRSVHPAHGRVKPCGRCGRVPRPAARRWTPRRLKRCRSARRGTHVPPEPRFGCLQTDSARRAWGPPSSPSVTFRGSSSLPSAAATPACSPGSSAEGPLCPRPHRLWLLVG